MFKKPAITWTPLLFIVVVHLIALQLASITFNWQALAICLFLHFITGCLGITLCFHRLLTHRSFKVPKWLEYILAICGTLAMQGGAISWVAVHRMHHNHSDEELDPHSPREGFWWSHIGWTFRQVRGLETASKKIDATPDLSKDLTYFFLEDSGFLLNCILGYLLYLLGGESFVIWGIFVRLVLVYHSTWFVNSLSHIFGYRNYQTKDNSKNNLFVALLSYGEGWHNNHHAFQYSARHGLKKSEFDVTYAIIRFLEKCGLATNVKIPNKI